MASLDLLLLHPPSVYDFREKSILYGPVSDLIPSSPVFEMYPLGFLTMTDYLEKRGLKVRIVNLALRMMRDPNFDVPAFLAKLNPKAVGIDLHWLPHAHGAIEIAKIVKEIHPDVPVIFGGLSSSYFHQELIEYPCVDYVVRGNTTEPALYELMTCILDGKTPERVPNLTWSAAGQIRVNPLTYLPPSLDEADLAPDRMMRMVLRHRDLRSVLPFDGWWKNPITAVFTAKGCAHQCVTCGSSKEAASLVVHCQKPIFRSPQNLVKNMLAISRFSKGPIFLVGDLQQGGEAYVAEVFALLKKANIKNEIVFELFGMPPISFLIEIDRSVQNWSLELSPESHDESIRRVQDTSIAYTNHEMELIICAAQRLRCHRIDVFFMIGLPNQTPQSVDETIQYCEHLFKISDERLSCFISPMGPFLDPGSRAFENPEKFGYRMFAKTLEEHRELLVQPSWQYILNYETESMTRAELTEATYDAAEDLNALKLKYGRIDTRRGNDVADRIRRARELKEHMDIYMETGENNVSAREKLLGEVHDFSISTVCDKRELFWRRHALNFRLWGIVRALIGEN